jgi:spectinomycin phosphotransferase
VRERPEGVDDEDVLVCIQERWDRDVDGVEHLPVGFGAHHWAVGRGGERAYFATLDVLGSRHSAASLEAAYRTATLLAEELDAVVAPLLDRNGRCTATLGGRALSLTPWSPYPTPAVLDGAATAAVLRGLHACAPPAGTPTWRPRVAADLADQLTRLSENPWRRGPFGEAARRAVRAHLHDLRRWTARYHALSAVARGRAWVVTHGEPHEANQLTDGDRIWLVDWESVKLAPPERDWRTLHDRGHAVPADPAMLELFDLEWRLDEVDQYARWLAGPHAGSASDALALDGLREELTRPDR